MSNIDIKEDTTGRLCETCACIKTQPPDTSNAIDKAYCFGIANALTRGAAEGELWFCSPHFAIVARAIATLTIIVNSRARPSAERS